MSKDKPLFSSLIIIPKLIRMFIAWGIGSLMYFILAIATVYDGFISMLCQPFIAMGVSAVITLIALIIGLPLLLLTPYRPQWLAMVLAVICLFGGFSLFLLPSAYSSIFLSIYPDQGKIISPLSVPIYIGYIVFIFTIVNWPRMRFKKPSKDDFKEPVDE